MDVKLGLSP